MYKHMADSIKESSDKRFVSLEDKTKYDNYPERFIEKENAFTKSEFDDITSKLLDSNKDFVVNSGINCIRDTKLGELSNLEILGDTIQRTEVISVTPILEGGAINNDTGNVYENENHLATDFIEVKYCDKFTSFNPVGFSEANTYLYDVNKALVGRLGVVSSFNVPDGVSYVRLYADSVRMQNIKVTINRTHLDDIKSVGGQIEGGNFELGVSTCGKNLIDYNKLANDCCTIEEDFIIFENNNGGSLASNMVNIPTKKGKEYVIQTYDIEVINGNYAIASVNNNDNMIYHRTNSVPSKFIAEADNVTIIITTEGHTTIGKHKFKLMVYEYNGSWEKFKPYTESKSDVVLPVQLEKVGGISDRLFKRKDGIWCIEKNIKRFKVGDCKYKPGSIQSSNNGLFSIAHSYDTSDLPNAISENSSHINTISQNMLSHYDWTTVSKEGVYIGKSAFGVIIRKDGADELNLDEFKEQMKSNNHEIMYVRESPEIIELPLETQIILNSFDGVTNLFTRNTEMIPTIKGITPITIGGSVSTLLKKSNNTNDRLSKLEKLETGSKVKYSGKNDREFIEKTSYGNIDDIKLEGETLVNLWGTKSWEFHLANGAIFDETVKHIKCITEDSYYSNAFCNNINVLKPSTYYTVITTVYKNTSQNAVIAVSNMGDGGHSAFLGDVVAKGTGMFVDKIRTYDTFDDNMVGLRTFIHNKDKEIGKEIEFSIVLLEGDHTDKDLSYFEGLKSVGNDTDIIEISSRKEDGNLINVDDIIAGAVSQEVYLTKDINRIKMMKYTDVDRFGAQVWVNVEPNTDYFIQMQNIESSVSNIPGTIFIYNDELFGNQISDTYSYPAKDGLVFNSGDNKKLLIGIYLTGMGVNSWLSCELVLNKTNLINGNRHESITRQLMYLNSKGEYIKPNLRGLPNGVRDTIEKHNDGKWYYHRRVQEYAISPAETSIIEDNTPDAQSYNTYRFDVTISNMKGNRCYILCDKFLFKTDYGTGENVAEGVFGSSNDGVVIFDIKKSKLDSSLSPLEGFKKWISDNGEINLAYEILMEEVYECAPLHLNTYDGNTLVSINAGLIPPNYTFTTNKYVGDIVGSLKERINILENKMIQKAIFQNKLLLTNTYHADETSLKVDITTKGSRVMDIIDYDIYSLIHRNIIVGKHNYDRTLMEQMIDFYTLVGKIDFELAEELFELIETQNLDNPDDIEEI